MNWTKKIPGFLGMCIILLAGVTSYFFLEEGKGQSGQSKRPSTPVEVVNTPLEVNVANWISVEPYKNALQINVPHSANSFVGSDGTLFVPPGKRLVIEHISAQAANMQGGKVTELRVCARSGNLAKNLDWHYLTLSSPVLTVQHLADGTEYQIEYLTSSQPIRLYADGVSYPSNEYGGAQLIVKAVVFADLTAGSTLVNVTISGYLTPIP